MLAAHAVKKLNVADVTIVFTALRQFQKTHSEVLRDFCQHLHDAAAAVSSAHSEVEGTVSSAEGMLHLHLGRDMSRLSHLVDPYVNFARSHGPAIDILKSRSGIQIPLTRLRVRV